MKTILGTGQVGLALLNILMKDYPTEEILVINRSGKINLPLPENVRLLAVDVTNKEAMMNIAKQSELIFSCTDVPYQMWHEFYPAITVALDHALKNSTARLVIADNLYSYGNVKGANMNEKFPHHATTRKGIIRANMIQKLLNDANEYKNRVAFVKAADFIGPGIYKGLFGTDFLHRLQQQKTLFMYGDLNLPHTFTYINDFAQAMINVGTANDSFGQIWHAPNATAMSLDKWIHLFEVHTSSKANILSIPKFVIKLASHFNTMIRELYELSYQFEYPYLVDHTKYVSRFGDHSTSPSIIVKETVQYR